MEMVPPIKFYLKLNKTLRQHQLNCAMCPAINFFQKKKIKNKNFECVLTTPKEPSGFKAPFASPIRLGRKIVGKGKGA
jgi:hypothetical protein